MGSVASYFVFKSGKDKLKNLPNSRLFDLEALDIDKKKRVLNEFLPNKKAFIFVNVASSWGLTASNYTQLEKLYEQYSSEGLEIFGFPCNQFMSQESGSEEDIKKGVITDYGIKFPMFAKIDVNGSETHPIYAYLKSNTKELNLGNQTVQNIPWNFAKFLVDSNGKVIKYYNPKIEPNSMEDDIKKML